VRNLRRRIERLEEKTDGDFETRLRLLSARLGGAEGLIEVARLHEKRVNPQIGRNGTITWEGFCYLHDLRALHRKPHRGPFAPTTP